MVKICETPDCGIGIVGAWFCAAAREPRAHMDTRKTSASDQPFLPFMEPPQDVFSIPCQTGRRERNPGAPGLYGRDCPGETEYSACPRVCARGRRAIERRRFARHRRVDVPER